MSRVLVIDDDPSVTRLLEEHLTSEGYEVTSTHLAEDGFQKATEDPPELIFLDVMLPDATGFQMLGRFRQNPITRTIPIIMMTGTARYANQQEIGKNMGANEYLLKPFDIMQVGDKVRRLIQLSDRGPLPQPKMAPDPDAEISRAPLMEEPPIMDMPLPEIPAKMNTTISIPLPVSIEREPDPAQIMAEPITLNIMPHDESTAFLPNTTEVESPMEHRSTAALETPTMPSPVASAMEEMPIQTTETPSVKKSEALYWTAALFCGHVVIAGLTAGPNYKHASTAVASGWALLLGLLVAACTVLKIEINGRAAMRLLGWVSIPIVARAVAYFAGLIVVPSQDLPATLYWMRPLDVFELAAGIVLGFSLRRLPGNSPLRCLWVVLSMAVALSLSGRGYFTPF